jgi:hypothetical protein
MSVNIKRVSKKEFDDRIDDAVVEGWKLKSKGDSVAVLEKRTFGGAVGHFVVLLLTFWFSFGLGNLAFAGYRYFVNKQELHIKVQK